MYCPNCKQEFEGKFCPECGTKLIEKLAGGFNLNLGDANAISGGVNLSDSHNIHNEDNSVHNTSNVSNVTHNTTTHVTNVAAQKSEMELLQDCKKQYLNACNRAYEDNVLDPEEKNYLDRLRMELGLDEATANSILESVRIVAEKNGRKTTLNPLAKTKLKILSDNLQANNVDALRSQIDGLDVFVSKYAHDELSRKYYLVLAALKPEKCIRCHESNQEDSYWRSFWSYIAYLNLGNVSKADEIIASMDKFADYPEDNITVLAVAGALISGNTDEAKECLSAVTGEYSPTLQRLVDSLYLILDPAMAAEFGATEETSAFYLTNVFGQGYSKDGTCKGIEKKAKVVEKVHIKAEEVKAKHDKLTFTVNGVSFNMIRVEEGTFTMGATPEMENPCDDEKPYHQVTLDCYYIGQTSVTQELWKAVMRNNPSDFEGNDLPVEEVSWHDCQKFILELNSLTGKQFRLPTEAEWEFAAIGGNKSNHTQYSGSCNIDDVVWYKDNSDGKTHPVATKQANELGIYDMNGNVYEWCNDRYGNYSFSSLKNPTGPTGGNKYVSRGGGWYSEARHCRSSYRNCNKPNYRDSDIGLRLCLSE